MNKILLGQKFYLFAFLLFSLVNGCSKDDPIAPSIQNIYRWEYIYGDTTFMRIDSVLATDTELTINWRSFGELNVMQYNIKYSRANLYVDLSIIAGKGTTPDTLSYTKINTFEYPDSVNFRLIQKHYDGSFDYHQFIVLKQ